MKTQHTPGPWHVHLGSPSIVRDEDGSFVAEGCSNADARLIAAAPELLEACEFALKFCEHQFKETGDAIPGDNCLTLRRAIAKAKGEA